MSRSIDDSRRIPIDISSLTVDDSGLINFSSMLITQTEDKKTKKKKKKRTKSASSVRRIKSGTKRRPDSRIKGILKQKPVSNVYIL
jgi:hypothetical protein